MPTAGRLYMCGETDFGQGNQGPRSDYPYYPKQVSTAAGFVRLAAGESHFVALKADGTVWAVRNPPASHSHTQSSRKAVVP